MMKEKARDDLSIICRMIRDAVDVDEIYLFGSYAYGSPNSDSDYDLCVVIPDSEMRPVDAVKKIRRALYPVQSNPMDVVVYHSSRFMERQRSASMERKIAREGVLLYSERAARHAGDHLLPAEDLREQFYEQGLPDYLQHDLDAYKDGLRTHSSLLDCLWGELYGSINMAEISDGCISPEHADYLRKKFLWGNPFAEDENSGDQSETEITQIL